MGNNLQALKTAKALTQQLAGNKPYLANDDVKEMDFVDMNGQSSVRPSMSPASVTHGQSSTCHKSFSGDMRKNIQNKAVLVNGAAVLTDNDPSNSFIYYLPETNQRDSQDRRVQHKTNLEGNTTITNGETTFAQTTGTNPKVSHSSTPVVVDLTLDDSDVDGDDKEQDTFPKILAAYSLHENSDLSNLITRNLQENHLKENGVVANSLALNTEKPNNLHMHVTSSQPANPREIVVSTSTLSGTMGHAGVTPSNVTSLAGHSSSLAATLTRINHAEQPSRTSVSNQPTSQESRVSFAVHQDHSQSRVNFAGHPGQVVNVGRLNSAGQSVPPNQPIMTVVNKASIDSQFIPLSSNKHDTTVLKNLNILRNKSNGIAHDNRVSNHNTLNHDQNVSVPINGLRFHVADVSRPGNVRNDVMHDVTNIQGIHGYEYRPLMLSSWGKNTDVRTPATTSSDSDDNVVITKVVTPTDKDKGRIKQRRKTPIAVRQWSPEEAQTVAQPSVKRTGKQLNSKRKSLENSLRDVVAKKQMNDSINQGHVQRETKIQTLKNLLEKQEKAVEKLRTQDNRSPSLPTDRVLLVEIPDLKSELRIPNKGEHSFRVCSQTITISPTDSESSRKRRRKRDPRKISRQEDRYPSYIEYKDSDDDEIVAAKRFKGKQKSAKSKSRGRNSPKPSPLIPVVDKDPWHRELEKAEAQLTQTGGVVDKNTFMLFLGLKKV